MSSRMTAVVTLQRETVDLGIGSDEQPVWSAAGTFRAALEPQRFSEASRKGGAVRTVQSYVFRTHTSTVRALAITAADRLVWECRTLNIREVRQPEPRTRFTEIVAEAGVTQ